MRHDDAEAVKICKRGDRMKVDLFDGLVARRNTQTADAAARADGRKDAEVCELDGRRLQ